MPATPPPRREDDLVGEAVGDLAGGVVGGVFTVLLGEYLGVLGVLGVEQEAVDGEARAGDAKRAKGHHGGVDRGGGPLGGAKFLTGLPGRGLRCHGLRDEVEDAGVGQVVVKDGVEGMLEGAVLGIGGAGLEVGYGDAGAVGGFAAELGADLRLGVAGCGGCGEDEEQQAELSELGHRIHPFLS